MNVLKTGNFGLHSTDDAEPGISKPAKTKMAFGNFRTWFIFLCDRYQNSENTFEALAQPGPFLFLFKLQTFYWTTLLWVPTHFPTLVFIPFVAESSKSFAGPTENGQKNAAAELGRQEDQLDTTEHDLNCFIYLQSSRDLSPCDLDGLLLFGSPERGGEVVFVCLCILGPAKNCFFGCWYWSNLIIRYIISYIS